MKLLFIRHADPDYSIDSLTPKGWKEAEYLAERLEKEKIDYFYVSPLGRAKDTAGLTLKKHEKTAVECEWLREFSPSIWRPDVKDRKMIVWDWLPQDWSKEECFFDRNHWFEQKNLADENVGGEYRRVIKEFDDLLAHHGYVRDGNIYLAEHSSSDVIALFCHFGIQCVLISHLLNVSPMLLLHGMAAAPSSVTSVVTEERRKGIASFRILSFGDISHLYVKNEPPSFAARFCECFDNADERHD